MSSQMYFVITLHIVFTSLVVQGTQAAKSDFFESIEVHTFPIGAKFSEDPDAVFRTDVEISTKNVRRKLLRTSTSRRNGSYTEERVANGEKAAKGQFPFVAYFAANGICTASLISPRAVLSAAHCLVEEDGEMMSDWSNSYIMMGSNEFDDEFLEYRVKGAWVPDNYGKGDGSEYGDIAVVSLATAVPSSVSKPMLWPPLLLVSLV